MAFGAAVLYRGFRSRKSILLPKFALKMVTLRTRKYIGNPPLALESDLQIVGVYLRIHSQSRKLDGRTRSSSLSSHFFIQRMLSWANRGSFR